MKAPRFPSKTSIEKELQKRKLEKDLYEYLLFLFDKIKREEFLPNWHHKEICKALMKVWKGEIKYLIINLPPRYTKTELVIKAFVSWCLGKNPKCKFIHLSYSDELALDNSSAIKEIVQHEEYQNLWPMVLKQDSQSKKKWFNTDGGGMLAAAAGGAVTGFGAGSTKSNIFSGAILIDDPIKPDDAFSDTERTKVNNRFNSTIKSRLNDPKKTPMIVIMQRLHEEDLSGFLLDGGSEYEFYHLNLPAINEDGPSEYDPREKGEALWPDKHDEEQLELMRIHDANNFAGQYQQRPSPAEGNIFKHFHFYKDLPEDINFKVHSWDFTFKAKSKTKNKKTDFVVGSEWGKRKLNGDIYLLPDLVHARMDFTDSLAAIKKFIKSHPDYKALLIEDKANGSAIISSLKKAVVNDDGTREEGVKRIIEIEPEGDKVERAQAVAPLFKSGNVFFPDPSICPWINDFINELKLFPNGKNDDRVDVTTQAVEYLDKHSGISKLSEVNRSSESFGKKFLKPKRDTKRFKMQRHNI